MQEAPESGQVSIPLNRSALQAGHDGAIQHSQELCIPAEAESPQRVQTVDHGHGVAAGVDHGHGVAAGMDHASGSVFLVLGEVAGSVATLI